MEDDGAVAAAMAAAAAAAVAAAAAAAVVVVMAAVAVSVGHCTYSRRRLFTLEAVCPFANCGCFLSIEKLGRRGRRLGRLGSSCYCITFHLLLGAAYALLEVLMPAHDRRRDVLRAVAVA